MRCRKKLNVLTDKDAERNKKRKSSKYFLGENDMMTGVREEYPHLFYISLKNERNKKTIPEQTCSTWGKPVRNWKVSANCKQSLKLDKNKDCKKCGLDFQVQNVHSLALNNMKTCTDLS